MTVAPHETKAQTAPRTEVFRRGSMRVYRYTSAVEVLAPTPVVLVPSIINTARIFDLRPGQSLAQHLLERGLDVYLIEWGAPRSVDAHLGLRDYGLRLLRRALAAVCAESGSDSAHLFGYCLGGVFALIAGSRLSEVAGVCTLATPVDLGEPGGLGVLTDERLVDLERLAAAWPVVPGPVLWTAFQSLDPVGIGSKWRAFDERQGDRAFKERFLAQERWLADPVPMTARALIDIVQRLYRENALATGDLVLEGAPVLLNEGRVPVLNLVAERDTIVPPAASLALERLWGGEVSTHTFSGGHIGVTVGSQAPQNMWAVATAWLLEHQ